MIKFFYFSSVIFILLMQRYYILRQNIVAKIDEQKTSKACLILSIADLKNILSFLLYAFNNTSISGQVKRIIPPGLSFYKPAP